MTPEITNQLQVTFGKALSKALAADPEIRKHLQAESLKMFDLDNDVLYQMVKDMPIGKGETLHDRVAHYLTADELVAIEDKMPLLTILVPTLPSGFSPETWQADQEVPKVAVRRLGNNKVPLYDESGQETIIQPGNIPGFPVVVVKQNERVRVNSNTKNAGEFSLSPFYQNQKFSFSFTASAFDGIHHSTGNNVVGHGSTTKDNPPVATNRLGISVGYDSNTSGVAQKVLNGYHIDMNNPNTQWQRDYVYYGIKPNNPKGRFNDHFRETMRNFRLSNSGIMRMSGDPDDPTTPQVGSYSFAGPVIWTDGQFEFMISILCNPKDGTLPQKTFRFGASPTTLYNISYSKSGFYYTVTSVTPRTDFNPNITIAAWDLQNFGTAWTYHVFEENQVVNTTKQETTSTTYAANFEYNASFGAVIKSGAKFGASASTTDQKVVTVQYTTGSTDLGEQTSYFYDPIVLSVNSSYGSEFMDNNGLYYGAYNIYDLAMGGSAGFVSLSVEPVSLIPTENEIP
ncbi:hypothetical protein GCM10027422_06080 [Hymenobacter arcticus]